MPELQLQYKDFSEWQNSREQQEKIRQQELYWLAMFSDEIPVLNLPTDYPRPLVRSFEGSTVGFSLTEQETRILKEAARETETTLFMAVLSLYTILLSRLSGQEDIVVGTPIAGRRHADLEGIVGMFVNTLALRNYPHGEKNLAGFFAEVKERTLQAFENQEYQFEDLVDNLKIPREMSRNPLFDVMLNMVNQAEVPEDMLRGGNEQDFFRHKKSTAKYDLTLTALETGKSLYFQFEYSTRLFHPATIERFISSLRQLIQAMRKGMQQRLSDLAILSDREKHQLLHDFNQTKSSYPKDKTIQELFEAQVEMTPDTIAVSSGGKSITYSELNTRANQLARVLREKGTGRDCIAGILMNRSIEVVIGILAIVKAGGCYLPIDPEYPHERILSLLEDSKARILLTEDTFRSKVKFHGEMINGEDEKIYAGNSSNLENINKPDDLVYVIYTSGSTGKPKGVMICHQGLINYITWAKKVYIRDDNVTFPLYSSLSFDLTVTSIFTPLISGNRIIIYEDDKKDFLITRVIQENKAGVVKVTPTHLNLIKEGYYGKSSIKRLIVGGEDLKTELARQIYTAFDGNIEIYNEYGPTEATVGCMIDKFDFEGDTRPSVPIGVPADNVQVYIVDKYLNPLPIGVAGELCIGGDGLARGYLYRPELTAEKFIPHPFIQGERIYKTGDLARWLPDGRVEFLGRMDHQVKIRGFRIEPGEIESHLLTHEAVQEAVVLAQEADDGHTSLCACLVSDRELTTDELRGHLSRSLPDYMIPSYFIRLEELPFTANGKIDRRALLEMGKNSGLSTSAAYQPPRSHIEKHLVEIWEKVLRRKNIGINDNFFLIGGHSLKAMHVNYLIQKELKVNLPLKELFIDPTIKGLAQYIGTHTPQGYKKSMEEIPFRELNEEPYLLLNKLTVNKIFCFPPITGYGTIYMGMASLLENCSIYAFNYLHDEENVIRRYIDYILDIQPKGPYVFLGYSAGGNIAFEITKKLEKMGHVVSDIILLDSYKKKKTKAPSQQSLRKFGETINTVIAERGVAVEPYRHMVGEKAKRFKVYLSSVDNSGVVNANLHLLAANRRKHYHDGWGDSTRKAYKVYQVYGKHWDILEPGFRENNREILQGLINTIFAPMP